ncbi:transposase [Nonomuraea basaltis]|uniref:transposase n=1 Tax=Nonomuraea basaltis TaxID=2495887 RepID=UPI00148692F1|nr:transposase [Nonomuraea basaltis]
MGARAGVQTTAEWKARYAPRSGIEGTISQAVAVTEIRRARSIGLDKTRLEHLQGETVWCAAPGAGGLDQAMTPSLYLLEHQGAADSGDLRAVHGDQGPDADHVAGGPVDDPRDGGALKGDAA